MRLETQCLILREFQPEDSCKLAPKVKPSKSSLKTPTLG